jgi:hypothetical protein
VYYRNSSSLDIEIKELNDELIVKQTELKRLLKNDGLFFVLLISSFVFLRSYWNYLTVLVLVVPVGRSALAFIKLLYDIYSIKKSFLKFQELKSELEMNSYDLVADPFLLSSNRYVRKLALPAF